MDFLDTVLEFNDHFTKKVTLNTTSSVPYKKIVVLTCMDADLTALLPQVTNLKNDQMNIIEIAGVRISNPYDSVMRSILLSTCEPNVEEIWVIGHYGCQMKSIDPSEILNNMVQEGKQNEFLSLKNSGVDLEEWLSTCGDGVEGVQQSVELIRSHPLVPKNILVHGLMIDQDSGKLNVIMKDEREPELRP